MNSTVRKPRRSWLWWLLPIVLLCAYVGVRFYVRAHVDELIQHTVGRPLPTFAIADQAGRPWTDADLRGKAVVLHFFRSRCSSCDVEAPAMRELERRLGAEVVMLHVMTDRVMEFAPELTAATLQHKQFARPVLMADAAFVDAFHSVTWSRVTPITYVVDPAGVVRYGLRGLQTVASVEAALAAVR